MRRQIVLGLLAIVVLLAGATALVLGSDWMSGTLHPHRGAPSIMIVTSSVLEQAAEIGIRHTKADSEDKLAGVINDSAAKTKKPPAAKAGAQVGDANLEEMKLTQSKTDSFSLEVQALQESLDGKISQDVDNSRRFKLIPEAKITDALIEFARENRVPPQNLFQFITGGTLGSSTSSASASSKASAQTSGSREESAVLSQGITSIARKVKADYTLIVTIGEPKFTWDALPAGNGLPDRVYMVAQPEVNCEIFDSKTGRAYRFANQIGKPISETVIIDPQLPSKAQFLTKLTRLDDRLSEAASQQVLALILDKVAPARLVQAGSAMVMNRGTNDGVADGAIYSVQREVGDAILEEDSGADLGKRRVDVGSVVVQSAEAAKSTVGVATGGPFLKGDIIVMALPTTPARKDASGATKPVGMPTLAVDHILVNQAESSSLGELVSSALASNTNIAVLPRAEMANLRSEAAHNGQASGDLGMSAEEGMRQSGYLVDGDCSTASRRHNTNISIGGVSETASSTVTSTITCSLRATAVDGRMIGSAQGSGGSESAAAEAAANALLARILPVLGVSAPTTGPPDAQAPTEPAAPPPKPPIEARPARTKRPRPSQPPLQDSEIHF